jgi:hypothetical protein
VRVKLGIPGGEHELLGGEDVVGRVRHRRLMIANFPIGRDHSYRPLTSDI